MPAFLQSLIDLYLARDLAGLEAINNQQLQSADAKLAADVEQRLILTRNHRMVMRMQARLQEGYAFIAVGALHLPGEQGILKLLEEHGYLVKYVY
ncbi:MAG: TraB/GumN family protein [Gammaproteobacteria bacterium]